MEYLGVVQARQRDLFLGLEDTLALALDAEKVRQGKAPRRFKEKSSLVAADIDLQGWGAVALPAKRK